MNDKQAFARFIAQKRKEAGVTQEELAARLFVTHTTVSKWERGLSYPDIALVPDVCRQLNISEHEFFTACDDLQAQRERREARNWRGLLRGWQLTFAWGYGIAAVTCFICNLAVSHRLDWFWIVLTSLALAFCFTNLPALVKKERAIICLSAATGCLLLLLLVCFAYTGSAGLGFGIAVTGASLLLPWGLWALARFAPRGRGLPAVAMTAVSVWLYLLLGTIALFGGFGLKWFTVACVMAALPLPCAWGIFAAVVYLPANGCIKAACVTALAALSLPLVNGALPAVAGVENDGLSFADYFDWARYSPVFVDLRPDGGSLNVYVFEWALIAAAVLLVIGVWQAVRRARRRNGTSGT